MLTVKILCLFISAAAALAGPVLSFASQPYIVPVRTVEGRPMIEVKLGSIRAEYMLDTGGQIGITVPPPLIVPTAGVTLSDKFVKMGDAAGRLFSVQSLTASDVSIGSVSLGPVKGLVNYQWGLSIGDNKDAPVRNNGVIGLSALSGHNLLFDLSNDRLLVFERSAGRPDLSSWLRVPFRNDSDGITIDLDVDGVTAAMVLDTGATGSVINRDSAVLRDLSPCRGKPEGANFCGIWLLKKLKLQSNSIPNFSVAVVGMSGVPFDGILGMDFFKKYRVFADFDQRFVYLKHY